jgi:hypothetical protein
LRAGAQHHALHGMAKLQSTACQEYRLQHFPFITKSLARS